MVWPPAVTTTGRFSPLPAGTAQSIIECVCEIGLQTLPPIETVAVDWPKFAP